MTPIPYPYNQTTADWCSDGSCKFTLPGDDRSSDADAPPRSFYEVFERKGVNFKKTKKELETHYAVGPGETLMEYGSTIGRYAYLYQYEPGFLHFNMLNKDGINMPFAMMGKDPLINHLFLAMYSSSIANKCQYCSTHGVALAATKKTELLKRMIDEETRSPSDQALMKFSDSLGRFPADLSTDEIINLKKYYTSDEVEWIVLAVALVGCNNFISQALNVKLDQGALNTAAGYMKSIPEWVGDAVPEGYEPPTKPRNLAEEDPVDEEMFPIWKLFRRHPYALVKAAVVEMQWKKGVPSTWPKIGLYLKSHTGYNFPLLQRLANYRNMTQCYGGILRDSFDSSLTKIGLTTKVLVQLIFSGHIYDEHLQEDACDMLPVIAKRENRTFDCDELIGEMLAIAEDPCPQTAEECEDELDRVANLPGIKSKKTAAVLILARAASAKPTIIDPVLIGEVASLLKPAEIMETIIWLGVLISFHRILRFYEVKDNTPCALWEDNDQELLPRNSGHGSTPKKPAQPSCVKKSFFGWLPWVKNE